MVAAKQQDGYVIVVVAALLVVFLGFAALAVDIGVLYGARTSLQRAADAAALAGASTFILEPLASQPTTAQDYAEKTAVQNSVLGTPIQISEVTVSVDLANRRVTVDMIQNENTYFAKALGWYSGTVRVQAIAEASPTSTSSYCTKPWFIPNTILSNLPGPCQAQAAGEIMVYTSGVNMGQPTAWAQAKLNIGFQFTVKPGNPASAAGPGQFYAIRLGSSSGGDDYRENISRCCNATTNCPDNVTCGRFYGVEPGNMIGPTKQGVDDLVTVFSASSSLVDYWVSPGHYLHPDGTTQDTSHQIIVAPIWDVGDPTFMDCNPSSHDYNTLKGGATINIKVVGFATLFLEGMGGGGFTCEPYVTACGPNDVIARLVGLSGCGISGIDPEETGPLSLPLRLIRTS